MNKPRPRTPQRRWFTAYVKHVTAKKIEPSVESLKLWDEKHNSGRIRESFGSREDVYQQGLLVLYRRFLDTHCILNIQGVSIRGIRTIGPHGQRGFIDSATSAQIEFAKARMSTNIENDTRRLLVLKTPMNEIRQLADAAWEKLEEEVEAASVHRKVGA